MWLMAEGIVKSDRAIAPNAAITARRGRGFYPRFGKRVLDIGLALPMVLVATPVIAVLGLLVVITSGWPPFYSSTRIGQSGRKFRIWKLRTMVKGADEQLVSLRFENPQVEAEFSKFFKLSSDPRITPIGRVLRRTSLDELPQLWSVLKGDMSLIGPRPLVSEELAYYGDSLDEFLTMKPGVGGLWQVSGRNFIGYPERARLELQYRDRMGFFTDLTLLVRTLLAAFRLDGR
jgi:lipopolysaccharide/colanic/teichoic acid biosynthesis glycosyltransferase